MDVAEICKDDIVMLDKNTMKQLGGIGPVLHCYKLSSQIHFIDPVKFTTFEIDSNTYWKYNLKSCIDRSCLTEFLVLFRYFN